MAIEVDWLEKGKVVLLQILSLRLRDALERVLNGRTFDKWIIGSDTTTF